MGKENSDRASDSSDDEEGSDEDDGDEVRGDSHSVVIYHLYCRGGVEGAFRTLVALSWHELLVPFIDCSILLCPWALGSVVNNPQTVPPLRFWLA